MCTPLGANKENVETFGDLDFAEDSSQSRVRKMTSCLRLGKELKKKINKTFTSSRSFKNHIWESVPSKN